MKATTGLMMAVVTGAFCACVGPVTAVAALPPDPDNAALLYYQAFLLVPQDDGAGADMKADVATGKIPPNDQMKEYLKKCRDAIDCALSASQLQRCDWGLQYSKGFSAVFPHLAQVRSLSFLILADARVLAAEGDYRQALERCLAAYRLAGHVGDEVFISFLVAVAVDAQANKCVTAILSEMPADVDMLAWLKGQLALAPVGTLTAERSMAIEKEVSLRALQPERMDDLPGILAQSEGAEVEKIRKTLTEPLLAQAREHYSKYMDSALAVLSGNNPYTESYAKLQGLASQMEQAAVRDPAVALVKALAPTVLRVYVLQTRYQADFNALRAALDVYLAKAGAGRLPTSLPAAAPRDPYTGGEFKYQPTGNGFVLRCGAKDLDKNEVRQYEFKVK
ncbi:MAG: hypothetical protein M1376_03495 [Planctomycetes bacterium]|nr:hypothetical protein [Planctomycetota bacterium]